MSRFKGSMKRDILLIGLVVGIVVILSGCAGLSKPASFDRKEMLVNLGNNVILPCHQAFEAETALLEEQTKAFESEPTEGNLEVVQQQWQKTTGQWKRCQLYDLGDVMILHNQIDKWPTNATFIDKFIAKEPVIDEAFIESIGSTSKGLPAIEYLIFDPELDNAAILAQFTVEGTGPNRMTYLVALAENLDAKANELLNVWSPEGDNHLETFVNADMEGGELSGSINMLANEMVTLLESVANSQLNRPMKGSYGTPQPQAAEAWRSQTSIPLIIENIQGFQQAFNGTGTAESSPGFDDYLDFLDAQYNDQPLSQAINNQTEATITALQAIDRPLHIAVIDDPEPVQLAYDGLKKLLVLVKVDMANNLGVTITFNDNDGD